MIPAFWDSSALVPLCVHQQPLVMVRRLIEQYSIVVWWSTSVEMRSAMERLLRTGHLTPAEYASALARLGKIRLAWRELQPSETLRTQAEVYLSKYPLKAADALQLAAAWTWSQGAPQSQIFISGDTQLLEAAQQVGFKTISA